MSVNESFRQFDLDAEIARFPPDGPSGRRSTILVKTASLRVVLVTMRAGTELQEHSAPATITVQPVQGRISFLVEAEERELAPGSLVTVEAGVRHTVRAIEDGAFLLTIGWPGEEGS